MNDDRASADGTVGKALDVLDQVAAFGRAVRFGELLAGSRYPKATLYRLLQTLTNQGMLAYDVDSQTYAPGVRLVRLAHAAWQQASFAPIARPHVEALSKKVGETVHLAQLDNGQVLYVDKRNPANPVEMFSAAGKVGPAYCTGVGKAMMAFLDEGSLRTALSQQSFHPYTRHTIGSAEALTAELQTIHKMGYGFDREEHEQGIICIAAPILSRHQRVLGGVSVTTSTTRKTLRDLDAIAPILKATAAAIADEVEAWRFPDAAPAQPRTASTG